MSSGRGMGWRGGLGMIASVPPSVYASATQGPS